MDDVIEIECPDCGSYAARTKNNNGYKDECHRCGYEDTVDYNDQDEDLGDYDYD